MNRKLILRLLGALLGIESAAMVPAFLVSLIYRDGDSAALFISIFITLAVAGCLWFLIRPEEKAHLRLKEGFIVTALGWILLSAFGALPFMLSGAMPHFEDAFFETVSGFTTTGASVLTQFEGFPRGVMLWRASTHWVGGMGVLVLTLALLPKLTGRTAHLVKAESPGPSLSKLVPKTGKTAKILYLIYIGLSLTEYAALLLCGMSPYDAAIHTMATAGTGGFSNYGSSIAAFNSVPIEMVITFFMLVFGVNFALYYKFLIGERFKAFYKDEEFRWYFCLAGGFILLMTLFNLSHYGQFTTSLRYSAFQVASIMSTTGFVTADFGLWPVPTHLLIIIIMFIGSCAGSTAGGMKVVRFNLLCKTSRRSIRATGQPKKVDVIRLDGKAVEESMVSQVVQFCIMYGMLVILGAFLLSLDGKFDAITHFSAALTCVSNVGPGLGAVGPVNNFALYGPFSKIVASFLMLFGRLELMPLFILFTRSAWHKY